ncbi:MAG TPA: S9 family peptidase [Actinomycetes bacterium]|nr:S9 family peptidase [Actinomycetes bacterium]
MRPADLLARLRMPSDPALSPDGSLAAMAVAWIDLEEDTYRSAIWVVPTDGSAPPTRLTNGPRDSRPRWSPDGRWLAFLRAADGGHPQLHVMPAAGGEPRGLHEHPLGVDAHVWSPDSTRLAYVARVPEPGRYGTDPDRPEDKEPPRRIAELRYRLDGVGFTLDRRPHVFVVDALAGHDEPGSPPPAEPSQVTVGDFDHDEPAWSPDGGRLAFVSARHEGRHTDDATDLFVVAAPPAAQPAGGQPTPVVRQVTRTGGAVTRPAFSPDGRTLYFVGPGVVRPSGHTNGLWAVQADGLAPPRRLSEAERWDLQPLLPVGSLPLLADATGVVSVALRRGAIDLVRFPVAGGEPERLLSGDRQVLGYDRSPDGDVIVAVVAHATSAGELVVLRDGHEKTLTELGAELERSFPLRPMRELTATAPDGAGVHGWVVKPAGTGPFPVLLSIHGGPHHQYGHALFDEAQVYTNAGYAVVMGNPRGSSGYGEAHGRAIVGDLGAKDEADLLALLDAALADPDLDERRAGVMGGSYGGFMTSWLAARTDRFVAGISERAVNDWASMSATADFGWPFVEDYVGEDPARIAAQSPVTHADSIRMPMLLIHSEQDWRCPLEQAQRLFTALKRNGVEAELLLFPGEGHELSRSGLPSHRVARFDAILDWWARHLGAS